MEGILRITNFVERLVHKLNNEDEWLFTATKDQDENSTPSFKVTPCESSQIIFLTEKVCASMEYRKEDPQQMQV
jgi:hypothetical protein